MCVRFISASLLAWPSYRVLVHTAHRTAFFPPALAPMPSWRRAHVHSLLTLPPDPILAPTSFIHRYTKSMAICRVAKKWEVLHGAQNKQNKAYKNASPQSPNMPCLLATLTIYHIHSHHRDPCWSQNTSTITNIKIVYKVIWFLTRCDRKAHVAKTRSHTTLGDLSAPDRLGRPKTIALAPGPWNREHP